MVGEVGSEIKDGKDGKVPKDVKVTKNPDSETKPGDRNPVSVSKVIEDVRQSLQKEGDSGSAAVLEDDAEELRRTDEEEAGRVFGCCS